MDENEREMLDEELKKLSAHLTDYRERLEEVEKRGGGTGEIKEATEKVAIELAKTLVSRQAFDDMAKKLDQVETVLENAKVNQEKAGIEPTKHFLAYKDYIQKAGGTPDNPLSKETTEFMASDEYQILKRTLTEGTGTAGGIFVTPEIEAGIIKNVVDINPIRSVARVSTIGSNELLLYKRTGVPIAYKDTELGTGTASQSKWAEIKIGVHPMTAITPVSQDLLDDWSGVESEIMADATEAFAVTEGAWFISGTGASEPRGIVTSCGTDANKFHAIVTSTGIAATDAVQADDFAKMWGNLKSPYRGNSTWLFNDDTLISILQLKATTGNYLWQPGLQPGPPSLIYGRPFLICPSIADEGSDTYPLYLGDWNQAYRIVDRSGIVLMRDPYSNWPRVDFKLRRRIGGEVLKAEAGKILKVS